MHSLPSLNLVPQEKEENKKLKQKQRDRMQPKVGKLDIDYQVLHDAFFKHQTKPHLTRLGEIYYEGKEFEARVSQDCSVLPFCQCKSGQER